LKSLYILTPELWQFPKEKVISVAGVYFVVVLSNTEAQRFQAGKAAPHA